MTVLILFAYKYYHEYSIGNFEAIRDLMQASIEVPIDDVVDAYLMFKDTPNIEIIKVEDQIDTLHKIVVNFIFNEQIVGEVEFRYNEYTARAHATEFLKKISKAE